MRCVLILSVAAVVLAAALAPAAADTVYLKNGRKMVGKVTVEEDKVIVETELGMMSFSRREVLRIEKDDKTLKVPKKTGTIPRKGDADKAWEVVPDMPYHFVRYAELEVGAQVVALNPRTGITMFGTVGSVQDKDEDRKVAFDAPSSARFEGKDAEVYRFYKIDTPSTLVKLMFFSCKAEDEVTLSIGKGKPRHVVFKGLDGEELTVREGIMSPEKLDAKTVYMVENSTARSRALESYLNSKGLKEGDSFTFSESDGTLHMGKLVRGDKKLELESDVTGMKLDWAFVDRITSLSTDEYEARMKRMRDSKSPFTPAIKPGDNVRAAIAAYGKASTEGDGISNKIGIEGASALSLYTRFFAKAGLWVSSRTDAIYEIETGDGFTGKIYGLTVGALLADAMKETDLYFYRSNMNNPRIMISDTLSPITVSILLDSDMAKIEKITITNSKLAGDWVVKSGVILRRLEQEPDK